MKNITKKRLKEIWELLDQADGSLYEVDEMVRQLKVEDKEGDLGKEIEEGLKKIDITRITKIKNDVEELLNRKEG